MKNVLGNVALNKILSLVKRDLSHKVDYTNELSEDDVRKLWNNVTGDQIPNILSLQHNHDERYYTKQGVNENFLMSKCKRMPDNYVMNCNDFSKPGFYHIGGLSNTPVGNAPSNNVGDYSVIVICDNYPFQVLLAVSPRDTAHMYIGRFWNREFTGWGVINFDKAND